MGSILLVFGIREGIRGMKSRKKKFLSEEYSKDEWEGVYKEFIEGKDNLLVKPGYSDPKTFQ